METLVPTMEQTRETDKSGEPNSQLGSACEHLYLSSLA
jgi:hypothetical protein